LNQRKRKVRDFIYSADARKCKRHDIVINAVKNTELTGHFHPYDGLDNISDTNITTSKMDELDILQLIRESKIAVYPGDETSNPAAMWECVAAGLPIIMNQNIHGGKHLVIEGVTGELANHKNYYNKMKHALDNLDKYNCREYFLEHFDPIETIKKYLDFFKKNGWKG